MLQPTGKKKTLVSAAVAILLVSVGSVYVYVNVVSDGYFLTPIPVIQVHTFTLYHICPLCSCTQFVLGGLTLPTGQDKTLVSAAVAILLEIRGFV
jgi:hypothetical protein